MPEFINNNNTHYNSHQNIPNIFTHTEYIAFCNKIRDLPELVSQASAIDEKIIIKFQEVKELFDFAMQHLANERGEILNRFKGLLTPLAKELLDEIFQQGEECKQGLGDSLRDPQATSREQWIHQAKQSSEILSKWQDLEVLTEKILELVVCRTTQLIDKDIQVIDDYQNNSINHISDAMEAPLDLKDRLNSAVRLPLDQLIKLKEQFKEFDTIDQAVIMIDEFYAKREGYFTYSLVKIDSIVKEFISPNHFHNAEYSQDVQNDLQFALAQFKLIQHGVRKNHLSLSERQGCSNQLCHILEDLKAIDENILNLSTRENFMALKKQILNCIDELNV